MANYVSLTINGVTFPIGVDSSNYHTIREDDVLSFSISLSERGALPRVFIEDAEVELSSDISQTNFESAGNRFFSECFGQSYVRIYIENDLFQVFFDVRARKASAEQAALMIAYLAEHHESLIRSCFSRSTSPIGSRYEGSADPESIISASEKYVNSLLSLRTELLATKRERLIPTRQPIWKASLNKGDVDPVDILNNLDAISPTTPNGDLVLKGRHFTIGDIDVSILKASANVLENQILLGGLYSIRNKLLYLLNGFDQKELSPESTDGYESFDRLLLKITSSGMVIRCNVLIDQSAELIRFFEARIGVSYIGDIRPTMTPYARTSKVYRTLYTHLANWYALGSPSFGSRNLLIKLRSLSKIYELYSLFHLIDYMRNSSWDGYSFKSHPSLGEYIPSDITMVKDNLTATIYYEPIIHPFHKNTEDNSLVDVEHKNYGHTYNYWNPDYVIRISNIKGKTKYIILDAKYSYESTVKETIIPRLVEKYYWGTSVYDMTNDYFSNNGIIGVIAVYPLNVRTSFLPFGKRTSIGSNRVPLPVMGGIGLAVNQPQPFINAMTKIFEIIELDMM